MGRAVLLWNYCYNPLYHKGELKGKVLNARLRKDQQNGTERDPFSSVSAQWKNDMWRPDVVTHQSYSEGPIMCNGQLFLSDWGCFFSSKTQTSNAFDSGMNVRTESLIHTHKVHLKPIAIQS